MKVTPVDTRNRPFVSVQNFRNAASENNSFGEYGFYAWKNPEKTALNAHYAEFRNADEAKRFVKENVDLRHCSFEEYWIASRILQDHGVLDSEKHWKSVIPMGLMLKQIPGVTNPIYTRYFDHQKHDWLSHLYEYANKDKKLGDSESAASLKEAADILSELVSCSD